MMMDWVPPACGGAAAQSLEAVRVPCAAGQVAELTAQWRELAAVVPHRVSAAPAAVPGSASRAWSPCGAGQVMVSASSPGPDRMRQAWRMILRASEIAARLPSIRAFTCA